MAWDGSGLLGPPISRSERSWRNIAISLTPFYEHFGRLVGDVYAEFTNLDVLLRRAVAYQEHGRNENEAVARALALIRSTLCEVPRHKSNHEDQQQVGEPSR